MKKSALMLSSLSLFCSLGHANQANYENNVLSMHHVSFQGGMYDVKMTFQAPDQLILMSVAPLTTKPDNLAIQISENLGFTLTDIMAGETSFRADISHKNGAFTVKNIAVATHGKMFEGINITNLGMIADKSFSYAYSISENSENIVGRSRNADRKTVPTRFHYSHGHIEGLNGLGGSMADGRAEARAVNNNGVLAGFDTISSGSPRIYNAFYNASGSDLTNIGTLGGEDSRAYGINNNDIIVGWSASKEDNSDHVAYSYEVSSQTITALGGDILGGKRSFAFGINDANQITGVATTANGSALAFIYENGSATALGSLEDSGYSEGRAINDKGQVTGWSLTAAGNYAAFIADVNGMQALPGFGGDAKGYGINTHGHVVGSAKDAEGNNIAFLYKDGQIQNLYDMLPEADKELWAELREGYSISDDGVIVGRGRFWTDKANEKEATRAFRIKF